MHFESHESDTNLFVVHKTNLVRHKGFYCYFMRHNQKEGGEVRVRRITRRNRRIHDELPLVAEKFKEFLETGEVTP